MNKEIVKEAFQEAENDLKEKQVSQLKRIIKKTLERIETVDKVIKDLQEEKKILKLDIDDLKEGRLDRIEERQDKDPKAKKVSVAEVHKEIHHHHYDRWTHPYTIIVTEIPYQPMLPQIWYTGNTGSGGGVFGTITDNTASANAVTFSGDSSTFTLTNSAAKANVIGTYLIEDKTVHLR